MTIAAAYLTSEGVIFGTDSATTYSVPGQLDGNNFKAYNHAQKLFEVGSPQQSRLGLCTWGEAVFGNISHRTIVARLSDWVNQQSKEPSVEDVASHLIQLVESVAKDQIGTVGYFIGGSEPISRIPACYRVLFINGALQEKRALSIGEALFSGDPKYFTRVFHGFDPELIPILQSELASKLGDTNVNQAILIQEAIQTAVGKLNKGMFSMLPLREAIDFIHMHIHLTIKSSKFAMGPTFCGGPIEIGFISVDRPFRWVRHKNFESAILEAELGERGDLV